MSLEDLKALTPNETTSAAKKAGVLKTTYMYDYAPYGGKRSALLSEDAASSLASYTKSSIEACPIVTASSAFYPVTAAILEAHYNQVAYEAAEQGLEPIATYTAFDALAKGEPLVVFASAPNDEQQADLDASGRDIRCEPVAREALIFYVRDDARTEGDYPAFTAEEVRAAFTAEDTDWQAFALEHGNGSTMCYEEFAQGSSWSLDVSSKTLQYPDMVSIVAGAALTNRSIGFAFHQFYQHNCSSPAMVLAEVDGVRPTWDTIRSGAYHVLFDMCVLFDANGPYADAAKELVFWLRSDEGQNLVADLGLCPMIA
jgi:phosphate transport system substrate-binding protein